MARRLNRSMARWLDGLTSSTRLSITKALARTAAPVSPTSLSFDAAVSSSA
jgi:hypothetical protein